jgi:hypothetical protein
MDDRFSATPWNTSELWLEANACLDRSIRHNRHRLNDVVRLAEELRGQLIAIFPYMDTLCRSTCPACPDSCCRRAWVWADFKDLLFLHLAGIAPPDRQLISRRGGRCRCGGTQGCRLDRIQRPFICTWYLCPEQTRTLNKWPAQRDRLMQTLQWIKRHRRVMEDRFIGAVCQSRLYDQGNASGPSPQNEISSLSMQQAIR